MQGWQRERIVGTYSRQTADCNGREIVHDGDCGIYNAFLGVCTCGLYHCLMTAPTEVRDELYPNFLKESGEKSNEGFIEYLLQEMERKNLYTKEIEGYVRVEKLPPIPQEEAEKIINRIFKKKGKEDD